MVAKREYQKELWYSSKAVDVADAAPLDQRNQRNGRQKRVGKITSPPANYFERTQNRHFAALNDALEDLEKERERELEEARQKAEEDTRRQLIQEEERGKVLHLNNPSHFATSLLWLSRRPHGLRHGLRHGLHHKCSHQN